MEKEVLIKKTKRQRRAVIFLILALVFIALAVKFTFFTASSCFDAECFQEMMRDCKSATYINDDDEATWHYEIMGKEQGLCEIEVILLQVKKGELEAEKLSGLDMVCSYPIGFVLYPEKDLEQCHGRLKEELQAIVIRKLHQHIIENLGEISEELANASGIL
jgi:hypothetical protein